MKAHMKAHPKRPVRHDKDGTAPQRNVNEPQMDGTWTGHG